MCYIRDPEYLGVYEEKEKLRGPSFYRGRGEEGEGEGGDNNSLKLRDSGRLEKQKLTLDTETD